MFTALLIIDKNLETNLSCSATGEQMDKVDIHRMEYYSAITRSKLLTPAASYLTLNTR
jgi:hypothetical protein